MDTPMSNSSAYGIPAILRELGIEAINHGVSLGTRFAEAHGEILPSVSPNDGAVIASVKQASREDYDMVVSKAHEAFRQWRNVPAPQRGEIVRQIGLALREKKEVLGRLVSYEMGKILQEGLGEVQEMIDICDYATGLSRMLYGMTTHSERKNHRMYEQYHPLGIVGVITAFNFPVAVWSWNAAIALVCGDTILWKPSSKVPLCAIAVQNIISGVLVRNNLPEGICNLVIGNSKDIGDVMLSDRRIPLISATGSTPMGKRVARIVGERLGRTILELGGNNAIIITPHANLELALRAVVFGALGTAGQRCTTTRRLIIHHSVYDQFCQRLIHTYRQIEKRIGHALDPSVLVGPLIDTAAVDVVRTAIGRLQKEGGNLLLGGDQPVGPVFASGCFLRPALAEVPGNIPVVKEETFGPLLYLMKYDTLEEAIFLQNDVPQGLSSAIFTENLIEAEKFLSAGGSDCGIANVNIGTSGAEIGGAFGGEKETGGGREAGSDAWKQYMRRQTNTINFGSDLPLAQGIQFDL